MTACDRTREWLDAWLDDELSSADRLAFERHIADCAACRQRVSNAELVTDNLVALGRAADRMAARSAPPARPAWQRRAAALRVAASIALVAGVGLLGRTVYDSLPHRPIAISAPDAQPDPLSRIATADEPGAAIEVENPGLLLRLGSSNPRVHVALLLPTPGQSKETDPETPGDAGPTL